MSGGMDCDARPREREIGAPARSSERVPPGVESVREWVRETERRIALAQRWLSEGKVGLARVVMLLPVEISPGMTLAETVAAFELARPGMRNRLRNVLAALPSTADPIADPTWPAALLPIAGAAADAEVYCLLVQDAAARGNLDMVASALRDLCAAVVKAVRAVEALGAELANREASAGA